MKRILILVLGLMIATAALAQDARYTTKVGDETMVAVQTPHPAPAAGRGDPAWQDTLRWEKATYIAVHFAKMELAPGEKVTISTPDGKFAYSYTGCGRSKTCSPFWAAHVPGDTALITYYANGEEPGFGYIVDAYAHGYPAPWRFPQGATEGICGVGQHAERHLLPEHRARHLRQLARRRAPAVGRQRPVHRVALRLRRARDDEQPLHLRAVRRGQRRLRVHGRRGHLRDRLHDQPVLPRHDLGRGDLGHLRHHELQRGLHRGPASPARGSEAVGRLRLPEAARQRRLPSASASTCPATPPDGASGSR